MPEYLAPGVYVEETSLRPQPIEGVPTSTAAFLGATERGPLRPMRVASATEYARLFGGASGPRAFMPSAVAGYFDNGGKQLLVCRVVGPRATTASAEFGDFVVRAIGPGSWGCRLWARIDDSTGTQRDENGQARPIGFRLRVACFAAGAEPFDPFADPQREPRPQQIEDFDDLSADPQSLDYYGRRLGSADVPGSGNSVFVTLERGMTAAEASRPSSGSRALLDGEDDADALSAADYAGELASGAARREVQGLAALNAERQIHAPLIHAPGAPIDVARLLVAHCEERRYRFAVIDGPEGADTTAIVDWRVRLGDARNAALYYPWLVVTDPHGGARRTVPPGGHVCGIYARTDAERGVHKSPADEVVRGAIDLEIAVDRGAQELLNPRGVNVIRRFAGKGIRVWGARTLSERPEWKYVNVRRLVMFVEQSIDEGLQWVVFEPNGEALWARIRQTIENFLTTLWRQGAFVGTKAEEAFFVRCDRTTMTQSDLDDGRVLCEVGVAPVRPAEFAIFRIGWSTDDGRP